MPTHHTPLTGYPYFSDTTHPEYAERQVLLKFLQDRGFADKAPLAITFFRRLKEKNYRLRTPTGQPTVLRVEFIEIALRHYLSDRTKSPHINYYPAIEECIAEIKAQPELYPPIKEKPIKPQKVARLKSYQLHSS